MWFSQILLMRLPFPIDKIKLLVCLVYEGLNVADVVFQIFHEEAASKWAICAVVADVVLDKGDFACFADELGAVCTDKVPLSGWAIPGYPLGFIVCFHEEPPLFV